MSLMDYITMQQGSGMRRTDVPSGDNAFAILRSMVFTLIPGDVLARAALSNRVQAHNEVVAACDKVFSSCEWRARFEKDPAREQSLTKQLVDSIFGLGPIEEMLADRSITEIMVNGTQSIYVEREGVLERSQMHFQDPEQVRAIIDRIIGPIGRRVDESSPMVNARLPEGHRVHVVLPPIAIDGPILTIRKFRDSIITLEEMQRTQSIEPNVRALLIQAVRGRRSIAVSGGTGTGKTTLLNALSCEIPPEERIVTIEDSAELRFSEHPHVVRLEARSKNAEGFGEVSIRDLVVNALRMRPDRIVVGECRGAEALDMLQAMNTGHDGSMTTLHANSPADAILRLTTMVRYAADLPVDVIESQIKSAIDLVVQITRDVKGRRFVSAIQMYVHAHDKVSEKLVSLCPVYERPQFDSEGTWIEIPAWMQSAKTSGGYEEAWR